ncbi:MAG: TlpA disulfide reductase family protein [Bryobacteraceae bacterium]
MRTLSLFLIATAGVFAAGDLSNRRAPGFSLPDSRMQQHDVQDYRGRIVLLEIMQTECPDCVAFAQVLEKTKAKYGDKVAVLSIVTLPDNMTSVNAYLAKHKITSPVLFDCGQVTASYMKITPDRPMVRFPHLFVIDTHGQIRSDYPHNPMTHDVFAGPGLHREIDRLLAEPKARTFEMILQQQQ